jgi:hypothetical protein
VILKLCFYEGQVGKYVFVFHLPNTITIHNLVSLNHSKKKWFGITLDPNFSHKHVHGLYTWGSNIVLHRQFENK